MRTSTLPGFAVPGTVVQISKSAPHHPPGRDNHFNFLRLMLASLVIVTHSCQIIDGDPHRDPLWRIFHTFTLGTLAVDGFFLVSGFLIVQSWQRQPHFAAFLGKRVLRIYPAFVAASLVCAFLVGPLAANEAAYFGRFDPVRFFAGLVFLKAPIVPRVFAGQHYGCINGAMWTISHEFHCYLLVPVLGWLGFVKHRRRWLAFSLVVLVLAMAFPPHGPSHLRGICWDVVLPESPEQAWRLLAFFCAGGCFCLFRDELNFCRSRMAAVAMLATLCCLVSEPAASLALPTAGAFALFWFAFADIPALRFFQSQADVSYGVYLYGWPVQSLLIRYFLDVTPSQVSAATFTVCVGIGCLSWHAVERPFLRLKPRSDPRDAEGSPAV